MKKILTACLFLTLPLATPAHADKAIPVPAATSGGTTAAVPVAPPQAIPPTPVAPMEAHAILQSAGPVTPAAPIDPAHRSCTTDADCALVQVRCDSCCPPPGDFDAVNKQYAAEDGKAGACTQEHIRSCGVPECGLFTPEPYPVATCQAGACAMVPHAPDPRTPPQ